MSSINTNLSAMTALQALKATQTAMNKNQNQISTGLRVSEASHNASYWSISTKMKSDNGALSAVKDSIKQSSAMINTYTSAMDKALTYLNKMKEGLVAAAQPGADLEKIQTEFNAHISGMKSAAGSATFNGQNWLSGKAETIKLVVSYDGNTSSVGTLQVNTAKTSLFEDAAAGVGGILGEVAKTNISGNAGYVDFTLGKDEITTGDLINFQVTGDAAARTFRVEDETSIDEVVASINKDSALNTAVVASKTDDGKLRLTAKDATADITLGTYSNFDNTATANTYAATKGTSVAGNGVTQGGKVTFAIDDTAVAAGTNDRISFTLTDGTEMFYTIGAETSVEALAEKINANTSLSKHVEASKDDNGNLVLTAKNPSNNIEGSLLEYTAGTPGVIDGTAVHGDRTASTAAGKVDAALKAVDEAIKKVTEGSSTLGANKALLETQAEFIGVLSDSLTAGVSAFIDADMNEVSTRNQALQTQQQLGVQALSMANQNSQMILRLFQ